MSGGDGSTEGGRGGGRDTGERKGAGGMTQCIQSQGGQVS